MHGQINVTKAKILMECLFRKFTIDQNSFILHSLKLSFRCTPLHLVETPYGSLPVLEVNGKMLGQSTAIARFVAVECGKNWFVSFVNCFEFK